MFLTLLEELIGLGIFRRVQGNRFTLRNANMLLLVGSQDQVLDELKRERELPPGYDAATFRSSFTTDPGDRSGPARRSPRGRGATAAALRLSPPTIGLHREPAPRRGERTPSAPSQPWKAASSRLSRRWIQHPLVGDHEVERHVAGRVGHLGHLGVLSRAHPLRAAARPPPRCGTHRSHTPLLARSLWWPSSPNPFSRRCSGRRRGV